MMLPSGIKTVKTYNSIRYPSRLKGIDGNEIQSIAKDQSLNQDYLSQSSTNDRNRNDMTALNSSYEYAVPSTVQREISNVTPIIEDRIDPSMPAIVDYNKTKHHFNVSHKTISKNINVFKSS